MRQSFVMGLSALVVLLCTAGPAAADTRGHWAQVQDWDNDAKTATIAVPDVGGFADAALTSTTAGPAGPESGATRWLGAFTGPGGTYGSSQGQQYLSLRPAGNSAASPSVSTYTFEHPTPAGGWAFTLGDVDAEYLDVAAEGVDGEPVDLADLGFRSGFNYCQGSPRPSGCSAAKAQPEPLWDATAGRLAGPEVDSDGAPVPGWSDTDGAAAWFEPSVPLRSLTVRATWRIGSPTYQTWFSALSRDASGTVTATPECSAADLSVTLRDGGGDVVASTTTAADGTWSVDDLATYDDWSVEVDAPDGCSVVGPPTRSVDLSSTDAVVDVDLEVVTGSVGGQVTETDGSPLPEVALTVESPDGTTSVATTDDDGVYGPVELPPGEASIAIAPPDGYTVVGDETVTVTVTDDGEDRAVDFTLEREIDPPVEPPVGSDEGEVDAGAGGGPVADGAPTSPGLPDAGGPALALILGGVSAVLSGLAMARRRGRA